SSTTQVRKAAVLIGVGGDKRHQDALAAPAGRLGNFGNCRLAAGVAFGVVGQPKLLAFQQSGTPPGPTTQSSYPAIRGDLRRKPAIGGLFGVGVAVSPVLSTDSAVLHRRSPRRKIPFLAD